MSNSRSAFPDPSRIASRTSFRSPSAVSSRGFSGGGAGSSRFSPSVGTRIVRCFLSNASYMRDPGCGISNTSVSARTAIRAASAHGTGRSKSRKKFGEPGDPVGDDQILILVKARLA